MNAAFLVLEESAGFSSKSVAKSQHFCSDMNYKKTSTDRSHEGKVSRDLDFNVRSLNATFTHFNRPPATIRGQVALPESNGAD